MSTPNLTELERQAKELLPILPIDREWKYSNLKKACDFAEHASLVLTLIATARERDELKAEVWRLEAGLERLSVATSQLLSGGTFEIDAEVNATPEEVTDE